MHVPIDLATALGCESSVASKCFQHQKSGVSAPHSVAALAPEKTG